MRHRFTKPAGALAAAALAAGLTMAGTGTARAAVTPPANTWAEIFAPEINANGNIMCADNRSSQAQLNNLILWHCHGYASDGTPQRWWFRYNGPEFGTGIPTYRIVSGDSSYCIGLDPNRVNAGTVAGSNLVQESCLSNLSIWQLPPAWYSPDPNNQFQLVNEFAINHVPYAMEANTFLDTNGNRLIAEPYDYGNSAQWFALG